MKIGYLVGAVSMTVLILIIGFQNITANTPFWMFFEAKSMPMTFPILFLSVFGMIAGSLYTLFIQSVIKKKSDETQESNEGDF